MNLLHLLIGPSSWPTWWQQWGRLWYRHGGKQGENKNSNLDQSLSMWLQGCKTGQCLRVVGLWEEKWPDGLRNNCSPQPSPYTKSITFTGLLVYCLNPLTGESLLLSARDCGKHGIIGLSQSYSLENDILGKWPAKGLQVETQSAVCVWRCLRWSRWETGDSWRESRGEHGICCAEKGRGSKKVLSEVRRWGSNLDTYSWTQNAI